MRQRRHRWYRWLLSMLLIATSSCAVYGDESERLFKVFDSADGLADNSAQVILCTKTGRLVICSIGHINFYNGSSFEHIDPTQQDIYELPKYTGHYHLYFDKAHHLWVKDKYQVTCVNLMTEQFIHDVKGVLLEMGFDGKAEDLFVDNDGCVLILAGNRLYNCKTKKSYPVRNGKNLLDVCSVEDKITMLFYDDSSIEVFDHDKATVLYIKTMLSSQKAQKYNRSSVLCESPVGFYQIRNGEKEAILLQIDAQSGASTEIMEVPCHLNNMALKDSLLYVAAEHGYWTFNTITGEKRHYNVLTRNNHQKVEPNIDDICFDLQGGMWVGTEKRGLLYSKPYISPFKPYPWSDPKTMQYGAMLWKYSQAHQDTLPRRVNCIYRDSRGWKWVGAYSGLQLYKKEGAAPIVYTTNDGLNNDVIHSIVEDDDHNIWVSTSNGICALMMNGNQLSKIVSFDDEDNIPKGTFDNGLAMKLEDGSIIMQSQDYIVEFNPAKFHTTKDINIKLYPKLIKLTVNGQGIMPGMELDGNVILDRAITRARELNLNYNQNTISLLITGLNYFRPVQTYYRVRVKGFKNEWETFSMNDKTGRVDDKGMLHYAIIGIPPGKYEIEVQASMTPNEWLVEPYTWTLTVNEPWWRMTIVYATLGLLLIGLLLANFVFFNRNMKLKLNRSNIEGGFIKRLTAFADICSNMETEVLAPVSSELKTNKDDAVQEQFADAMLKVVPMIKGQQSQQLTMVKLSEAAQMDVSQFYELISNNFYNSPHAVVLKLRLQHVAELLVNSEKSVEEIAKELNFSSPNYMIASFYHQYRMTPEAYRTSNPR